MEMSPVKFAVLKYFISAVTSAFIMFGLGVSGFTVHPLLASIIGVLIILLLSELIELYFGRKPDSRTRIGELDA